MSPAVAWLIAEVTKMVVEHVQQSGKFNSLTEEEAKAMVVSLSGGLQATLPSPEELERG